MCSAAWTASTSRIARPEAYRGETCWLFHNRGNGTFEDVTASSGIFDSSSKSLGVAMLDYDHDGWPDLFVANDTQPNKLYRNHTNGTFKDVAVEAGIAFSNEGKARAGMGVDVADFDNSGVAGVAITNFDNEMIGLYRDCGNGHYVGRRHRRPGVGRPPKTRWDSVACFWMSIWTARSTCRRSTATSMIRSATFAATWAMPSRRSLFLNDGQGKFREVAAKLGGGFSQPKVGRGLAYGDFDRDGDLDLLMTTNNGPAYLYRNDQARAATTASVSSWSATKSNRDAIGATVRIFHGGSAVNRGWSRADPATCRNPNCR